MDRKDIERIVDLQGLFDEPDQNIADNTGHDPQNDGTHRPDEPRSRSNCREAGNGTGYETDQTGSTVFDPFDGHPGQGAYSRRNMRHRDGHTRAAICTKGAAAIEAIPANPQHGGADHDQSGIMRR